MLHPINTDWLPADSTNNRAEIAGTKDGFVAVRNSHDPDEEVYFTPAEIRNFADFVNRAQDSRLRTILGGTMT